MIENCPNAIYDEIKSIAQILLNFNNIDDLKIKITLAHCWYSIIKNNKDVLLEFSDSLIQFFLHNFAEDDYELNFSCAEFFNFLVDENENILSNDKINLLFENRLNE